MDEVGDECRRPSVLNESPDKGCLLTRELPQHKQKKN